MTVKELKEKLNNYSDDTLVLGYNEEFDIFEDVKNINKVTEFLGYDVYHKKHILEKYKTDKLIFLDYE